MTGSSRWSRILVIAGLVVMLIGAIDPLEGSLVIVPGVGMVALGAMLGKSRYRKMLYWAFALVAVGVGLMFGMSAMGDLGGETGRSMWWALILLPYPIGWVMGIVGAIRRLREAPAASTVSALGVGLAILMGASFAHAADVSIQGLPPVVVKTVPESGSVGVDPGLAEIKVTFSKAMRDKSWSCVTLSKETFPAIAGEPRYEGDKRTLILPVKLEPGKTYAIMLNSEKHKNFKDAKGNAAMPYLLIFETKR